VVTNESELQRNEFRRKKRHFLLQNGSHYRQIKLALVSAAIFIGT
jgi:hypothetical protein